jgi:glutamate 5-kinase
MSGRRRLVVKIGSQVLCDEHGRLDVPVLANLVRQVVEVCAQGWQVVLVSSGAVAAGAGLIGTQRRLVNPVTRKQVLAAAGQAHLMETYQRHFRELGLTAAQVLATKSDFQSRAHYLNMRACIDGVLEAGLVPVINENDVVSVTELMFTDNDELAGLVAGMLGASRLCLLSSVPGVYSGSSDEVIDCWDETRHSVDSVVSAGTSSHGRGGMHSKLDVARKVAGLGIEVVIADGRAENILADLAEGRPVGTRFTAGGAASPTKRWLASMDDHALGAVTVNEGAELALLDRKLLASLLPVGVTGVEGEFRRGDVIQVRNAAGRVLGCGRAQYDHGEAQAAIGQRDRKPLIHYDYLYLLD